MAGTGKLTPGVAYPLGAHWDGKGINFSLVAPRAQAVELCLFNSDGTHEVARMPMPGCEHGVWHGYLGGAQPGLVYGYRVAGPYAPQHGQRFNAHKVLLDPYARLVVGHYQAQATFGGHDMVNVDQPDLLDNADIALKARVIHEPYDWEGDSAPRVPDADTVLYEVHVKGMTQRFPDVPQSLRGSYGGMTCPAVLDYLQDLGITTVSVLPLHHRADEARLQLLGLSNYWGYSSIAFFAPETRYWSGRPGTTPVSEFRDMVKALHARGLEVVMDVVYNHTAETDEHGPTLSFRGIDNALYYHLRADNPALYENWTGCGNCLNLSEPRVVQLVMDSLRYWVEEMHVDGFRFDLAPMLGRHAHGFSASSAFLTAIRQDPVLARVKLIAEPWDLGPNGYQLGNFPAGWLEWNDRYRNSMRAFWLHHGRSPGEFARRFAGSSDVFHHSTRLPAASVNFITAHDGFTLRDLVSYNHKHNEENGEDNRDGHHHNGSWNCGVEGPTDAPEVLRLRGHLQRALLATLLLSQGTPMLLAGDELGHSQRGNNNAYCQDNPLCWLDWTQADHGLVDYTRRLIAFRKRYLAARHGRWYKGEIDSGADMAWLTPDGRAMTAAEWNSSGPTCIGIWLQGCANEDACLLLFNTNDQSVEFTLPRGTWYQLLSSTDPAGPPCEIRERTRVPAYGVLMAAASVEQCY